MFNPQVEKIMSFIIAVTLISVWTTATSGKTLGPSTSTSVPNTFDNPNPYIVTTMKNVWRDDTTCEIIFNTDPSNPTGYYLKLEGGKLTVIHCNMDQILNPSGNPGGSPGGSPSAKHTSNKNIRLCERDGPWTRIGYLNMSESLHNCPPNWEEYTKDTGGIRTCQRKSSGASCDSVIIPSNDIHYAEICGRIVGYQYGFTDAVSPNSYSKDINGYYVDGVSITHGTPRKHVWTLMSGLNQYGDFGSVYSQCPCYTDCNFGKSCSQWVSVESFIGNDWYCESGNDQYDRVYSYAKSHTNDPLWDGKGCSNAESPCCAQKTGQPPQPWFYKSIPGGTKDHLEIRICCDYKKSVEDVLVTMYELYVK